MGKAFSGRGLIPHIASYFELDLIQHSLAKNQIKDDEM
jgi:hypothetical protein